MLNKEQKLEIQQQKYNQVNELDFRIHVAGTKQAGIPLFTSSQTSV